MKHLLLVGGGHSHLAVLKSLGDAPAEGARLTLLSPNRHAVYSGMIPGLIAGHYRPEECRIDLRPLAARAGGRFIEDSAAGVDLARREVTTAGGGRLVYDLLSLDIGSTSGDPARVSRHALRLRPVEGFLAGWERLREAARRSEVRRIAVVGGGAGGVEVLLAMQHALAGAAVEFALFDDTRILGGHNAGVRRRIGPSWIAQSGLATDPRGFVAVSGTLRSPSHPEVFAAGDCATIIGDSRPKSGVIAVRQGPILAGNLRLALAGAPPEPFRAPARALALISCGDRYAVASWASFALEGSWVWRCKDRIDRRFVQRYRLGGAGD